MSGGVPFRGTSLDNDDRYGNGDKKLIDKMTKDGKFPAILNSKINLKKINIPIISKWVAERLLEILGYEDDIVTGLIVNILQGEKIDGKRLQLDVTGFLEKQAGSFIEELWQLLIDAQEQPHGIPSSFIQKKKEEILSRNNNINDNNDTSKKSPLVINMPTSSESNNNNDRGNKDDKRRERLPSRDRGRNDDKRRERSPSRDRRIKDDKRRDRSHSRDRGRKDDKRKERSSSRDRGRKDDKRRDRSESNSVHRSDSDNVKNENNEGLAREIYLKELIQAKNDEKKNHIK